MILWVSNPAISSNLFLLFRHFYKRDKLFIEVHFNKYRYENLKRCFDFRLNERAHSISFPPDTYPDPFFIWFFHPSTFLYFLLKGDNILVFLKDLFEEFFKLTDVF